MKKEKQHTLRSLAARLMHIRSYVVVLVTAIIAGMLSTFTGFTSGTEQFALSYNILAAAKSPQVDQKAVIIMCTDNTLDLLPDESGWPISRSYYTKLLNEDLSKSDLVVFDILFSTPSKSSATDIDFANAIKRHGNVILSRSNTETPSEILLDSGARIGYALEFKENDSDGVNRRYKLYLDKDMYSGMTLIGASFAEQGYKISFDGDNTFILTPPKGDKIHMDVDDEGYFYRIPIKRGIDIPIIDLYDVYTGKYSPGLFDDAVVFIGGTVAGYEDIVYAPDFNVTAEGISKEVSTRVVGTKFLADSYFTVLRGFSPQRLPGWGDGIICTALFFLIAIASLKLPAKFNWAVPISASLLWFLFTRFLFTAGVCHIPFIMPVLCMTLSYLLCLILNLLRTSYEWQISSLPIETLYHITYDLDAANESDSYESYINNFSEGVFNTLGVRIIEAQTSKSGDIAKLIPENTNGTRLIHNRTVFSRYGVRTLIIIPLPSFDDGESTYTVLGTDTKPSHNWVQSVTALILVIYVYYNALRQSAEKQQMAMSMIHMIIQMIDAKDPVTAGHSRRVSQYSRDIAKWLGYDKKRISDIEFAALLHDIGKIGVEDAILNKPGLFTKADYEQMKSHPYLGAEIVRTVGLSDEIVDGVLHHHERIDGKGYPSGSCSTEHSEFARIIKVADVYDALSSNRQYKNAWDQKRALDAIYYGIGTEFDERIARTFIENTAPDGYIPGKTSSEQLLPDNIIISKAIAFAHNLWKQSSAPLIHKNDSMSSLDKEFDFDCTDEFAFIEWGERFSSGANLKNTPAILSYTTNPRSTVCALRGIGAAENIIMYYHKNCLSAGIVTLSAPLTDITDELTRIYSEPVFTNDCTVWRSSSQIIVMFNIDGVDMIAYITNYLANEI